MRIDDRPGIADRPDDAAPALSLVDFRVRVAGRGGETEIVRGLDLAAARGASVGIVGESGCGKSLTWLAALRLAGPGVRTQGRVMLAGPGGDAVDLAAMSAAALGRVRGGRIAMIFQDPGACLNPIRTVGRQIGEALALHRGLRGAQGRAETIRLLDTVGIPDAVRRLRAYPHELSGGTNQRVMIAMALAGEPDVLVADEPTAALDATIQAQILDLLATLRRELGLTLVLISHDLGAVAQACDTLAVMYAGRIVEYGPTAQVLGAPAHPYTAGLRGAIPDIDAPRRRLAAIPGTVPSLHAMPPGCSFAPRCERARPDCTATRPALAAIGAGREARRLACFHPLKTGDLLGRVA